MEYTSARTKVGFIATNRPIGQVGSELLYPGCDRLSFPVLVLTFQDENTNISSLSMACCIYLLVNMMYSIAIYFSNVIDPFSISLYNNLLYKLEKCILNNVFLNSNMEISYLYLILVVTINRNYHLEQKN